MVIANSYLTSHFSFHFFADTLKSFVSYSHARPGKVQIYVPGVRLRNHLGRVQWDNTVAAGRRGDAARIEEVETEEQQARQQIEDQFARWEAMGAFDQ